MRTPLTLVNCFLCTLPRPGRCDDSFCFAHTAEYWALEAAMGLNVPHCKQVSKELNCPKKSDIDAWHANGMSGKIHLFYGHHSRAFPLNDITVPPCEMLYAGHPELIKKHC